MSKVTEDMLPELPEKVVTDTHLPTGVRIWGYTATQMHDYARAALEAALSQGEAVDLERYTSELCTAIDFRLRELDWDVAETELHDAVDQAVRTTPRPQPAPQSEPAGELSKLAAWWRNRAGPWDQVVKKNPENIAAATVLYECADELGKALAATGKQSGRDIGAFELWAKSAGLDTKIYDHNNMYSHPVTRGAWIGWQAATASRETGVDDAN